MFLEALRSNQKKSRYIGYYFFRRYFSSPSDSTNIVPDHCAMFSYIMYEEHLEVILVIKINTVILEISMFPCDKNYPNQNIL